MSKQQIILLSIIGAVLVGGILLFVFIPRDNTVLVETENPKQEVVSNKKTSQNKKGGIKLDENFTVDPNEIPDPKEVEENSEYINFENTIDKLIDMTDR